MLKFRKKLAQYQEQFYLVFILSMVGLISAGFNSTDKFYLIVFFVATLFLLLKMAITDFTKRELLWMAVITLLLGINFMRNGEKTLIMTAMGIFGAKNVSMEKVFRYSLWMKVVLTIGTVFCAATGIIENELITLPKNGNYIDLYCYGYYSPNLAFGNIFMIFIFAVCLYWDKLKWYAYVGFTLVLWGAYKVLVCRTGLVVWAVLLIMVFGYKVACRWKWEKIYLTLHLAVPAILALLTFVFPLIGMRNDTFLSTVDYYLTGRIHLLIRAYNNLGHLVLGNPQQEPFDSSYFHLVHNYGWVMFAICLLAYLFTMWHCIRKDKHYEVIVLSAMSAYGFMELWPLSVGWNLPLLFLSLILFKREHLTES